MSESKIFSEVTLECLRCGTRVRQTELAKSPEATCPVCGYRVFRKVRPQVVKQVRAV